MCGKFWNICGNLGFNIFISDCDVLQLLTGIVGNLSWYSSCVFFLVDIRFRCVVDAWKMLSGNLVVFPFITWSFFGVVFGTSFVESSQKSKSSTNLSILIRLILYLNYCMGICFWYLKLRRFWEWQYLPMVCRARGHHKGNHLRMSISFCNILGMTGFLSLALM